MKNSGKTVSNCCAAESVAVRTTRPRAATRRRNGKLAPVVLTNTSRPGRGSRRAGRPSPQDGKARARGVDNPQPARQRLQEIGPLGSRQIRSDEVELGFV